MKKIKPIHISMRKLKAAERRHRQYAGLPHCDGALSAVHTFLQTHPHPVNTQPSPACSLLPVFAECLPAGPVATEYISCPKATEHQSYPYNAITPSVLPAAHNHHVNDTPPAAQSPGRLAPVPTLTSKPTIPPINYGW